MDLLHIVFVMNRCCFVSVCLVLFCFREQMEKSFSFCFVSFFSLDLQKGKLVENNSFCFLLLLQGGSTCLHCSFNGFVPKVTICKDCGFSYSCVAANQIDLIYLKTTESLAFFCVIMSLFCGMLLR